MSDIGEIERGEVVVSDRSTGWTLKRSEDTGPQLLVLCNQYDQHVCLLSPANAPFFDKIATALRYLTDSEGTGMTPELTEDEIFLRGSGVFYEALREPDEDLPEWLDWDDTEDPGPDWGYSVNMNDAFAYACADAEFAHHSALPELARLVRLYGPDSGPLYWVAMKRGFDPSIAKNREKVEAVRVAESKRI